jgi:hypothetical protein
MLLFETANISDCLPEKVADRDCVLVSVCGTETGMSPNVMERASGLGLSMYLALFHPGDAGHPAYSGPPGYGYPGEVGNSGNPAPGSETVRHTRPIPVPAINTRCTAILAIEPWSTGRLGPTTLSSLLAEVWPKIHTRG